MTHRISMVRAALWSLAIAIVACLCATSMRAQPLAWNPPCTATKLVNLTPCPITVTVRTNIGIFSTTAGPNSSVPFAIPAGTTIFGILTQASTFVGLVTPGPAVIPPPAPPGRTAASWVSNVTIGPGGCCVDIYFDQTTPPGCYIGVLPTSAPPPCIP